MFGVLSFEFWVFEFCCLGIRVWGFAFGIWSLVFGVWNFGAWDFFCILCFDSEYWY